MPATGYPSEAFSFQIATDDQSETDRYWNAIVGNGGQASHVARLGSF
jgi:predicted 3-demethylubiquinone-9 3-methyltransferase (glyoxalase superfamily)